MANRRYTQFFGTLHYKPVRIDCKFEVQSADTGGYGVINLKGGGVAKVFMHTSATPAGLVNPVAGMIYVQLQDNFNNYYYSGWEAKSPVTGAGISISGSSVLTIGAPYQITSLGTTTQAQWVAAGLPIGATAAVGAGFLSRITGTGSGTGQVKAIGHSGVQSVELIGDPLNSLRSSQAAIAGVTNGAYLLFQALGPTGAGDTTPIPVAPADGTVMHLTFELSNSFLQQNGD